jgi:penicillin-binding protein 1C
METVKSNWKNIRTFFKNRKGRWFIVLVLCVLYYNSIPSKLFEDPTSTILLDQKGELLGAQIATDGQWRFPASDSIPKKFETCIIAFEDRNFYRHIGVSFQGIFRAIVQNIKKGKVHSGGSTISMQVVRLYRKNPKRSWTEKIVEMIRATRIELSYSKKEILNMYASNAPFGNNVVGLEAASWRFYGRPPHALSWGESATLAVLPNAPGLIYPGKNSAQLKAKRNRLLRYLYEQKIIDGETLELAIEEPLPNRPKPLPQLANHVLQKGILEGKKGKRIETTLSSTLQEKATMMLQLHAENWKENEIFNGAILISSVKTGEILAYVGNTHSLNKEHSSAVNCLEAKRSSGSILKPLLFAKSLEKGIITPDQLIEDIPAQFGNYSPKNFSGNYEGALPVKAALTRSLNVPMVHLLQDYGLTKFHADLQQMGLTTMQKSARHYGLTLILGGAEVKPTEIHQVYGSMAQQLVLGKTKSLHLFQSDSIIENKRYPIQKEIAFTVLDVLKEVNRPDEDNQWNYFSSSQKIAWKTGTSYGFRDAWAIGVTPDYVVTVWVGNASGEGRPGLTGIKVAAPLMFDIFRQLPQSKNWFSVPIQQLSPLEICMESGYLSTKSCPKTNSKMLPKSCQQAGSCPYHQNVHVSTDEKFRVNSACENVYSMKQKVFFILPPIVEKYYKITHPNLESLPPFKPGCESKESNPLSLIYPKDKSFIYIPIELNEERGKVIFEAIHRHSSERIFWHLDENYLGETNEIHQLAIQPSAGKHVLSIYDSKGNSKRIVFEVAWTKRK